MSEQITNRSPTLPVDSSDLKIILDAWTDATDRLQRTHETLQEEVRRLTQELEQKNRELARRNRLADLGQMASHIAHEVRNGLVPMKLYHSLLRRRVDFDSGAVDIVNKVLSAIGALEATVNDLLNFSADRDPQRTVFAVDSLLAELCDSLAPQFAAQEIRLWREIPPRTLVTADRDMLRRAVLNLILNAVDVMPNGGDLVITACNRPSGCEIEIADSGPGLPDEVIARMFEPFFTTKPTGTGLGLAIVERILESHGGKITAANCPEGGAAFTLFIPAVVSGEGRMVA